MVSHGKKQTTRSLERKFESRNIEHGSVSTQRENNPVDPGLINIAIEV